MKRNVLILLVLSVIAGAAIFYHTGLFGPRKVGSYEYVRKAEKYIEEEKYEKAVSLLNEAYERSPASGEIKKELLYGYLMYARHLDGEGKLDRAIDRLLAGRAVDGSDPLITHDLAHLYGKKAVLESENKEFIPAFKHLQKAMDLAMASKKIRKSISNYMFNKAVEAYQKSDGETLLLCLNASHALWTRFETLDFLGQYYFRGSKPDKALFYWGKAALLRPDDAGIRGKIETAEKEMVIKEKMDEIETEHFNVRLYREYDIDPEQLNNILKSIYCEVGKDLNYYPPLNTLIIFYNEEDFREIFKQQGIVRAFYDGSIRMVFTTDTGDQLFPALVAHEYTHAVLSILTDNKCPVWLHEGTAVLEQMRYMSLPLTLVRVAVKNGERLTIGRLQSGFHAFDRPDVVGLSYEGAYTAVSFIIDKWGWPGLRGLLQRIREGKHFANAMDEEFYISVKGFEEMWNEYLREKFGR